MILLLNKSSLYSVFAVDNFQNLDEVINNMSPSMVEYYLSGLSNGVDGVYLNKKNIQNSIHAEEYSLHIDYNDEIYLEIKERNEDLETHSLW